MFEKRLFRELKLIKGYWPIQAAVSFAAVFLTLGGYYFLTMFLNGALFGNLNKVEGFRLLLVFLLLFGLKAINSYFRDLFSKNSGIRIKQDLKNRILLRILDSGELVSNRENTAGISSEIINGGERIEAYIIEFVPHLVFLSVSTVVLLITVAVFDVWSAVIMALTAPLVPVFMILIGKTGEYVTNRQWHTLKDMNGYFFEVLRGLSTLKLFNQMERRIEKMAELDQEFRKNTIQVLRVTFLSALVLELLTTISTAVVAVSLGLRLLSGHLPFTSAFFVLLLTPEYFLPLRQMGTKYHIANSGKIAAGTLFHFLEKAENTYREKIDFEWKTGEVNKIIVAELGYSYNENNPVFSDANAYFTKGEIVGVAGKSGAGKTTFAGVLMGYLKGYIGEIRVDGVSISEIDPLDLRKHFGYVPQKPIILNGTFLENLLMGKDPVPTEILEKALDQSGVRGYFQSLPNGLETKVGEGGHPLSGGQMLMLALCRSLLKKADVIVLDEPEASLDEDSEQRLNDVLNNLKKDHVIILIAHRKTTLFHADRVYNIENGTFIEEGAADVS